MSSNEDDLRILNAGQSIKKNSLMVSAARAEITGHFGNSFRKFWQFRDSFP